MTSIVPTAGSRRDEVPRLIRFAFDAYGVIMSCHYCRRGVSIGRGDASLQILEFQEAHFTCDPVLGESLVHDPETLAAPRWLRFVER